LAEIVIAVFLLIVLVMAVSFLLSLYHFGKMMLFHKKEGAHLKIALFAPFSIFYAGYWTDEGNQHREKFFKYFGVSLIGGLTLFVGKVLIEYIKG